MKTTISMYLGNHPLIGVVVSGVLVTLGFGIGGDLHLQVQPVVSDQGLPAIVKDCFQCLAWTGAGITGFVAGHGYWVKYAAPKIGTWKEKRKSRKK